MTTEQTKALNALNYLCGLAQGSIHYPEAQDNMESAFKEVYLFIYPKGSDEQEAPEPADPPCECDM